MRVIGAPWKYPDELRERSARRAVEARQDPATEIGALARIGQQLAINPETLRNWVRQSAVDESRVRQQSFTASGHASAADGAA